MSDLERPTVIVTSANPGEGKSLTCANLALSFAHAGQRVVLVDLDLRHSNAHKLIGGHNEFGVTDVLLGRHTLEECLQYVELAGPSARGEHGLYFLATGPPVTNPAELLSMGKTARMLESLSRQADLVLLDTPPVLPVADTLVIGRMAAGALLVVQARKTEVRSIQKAKDLLIRNQTRLLGIVLNKFQERDASGLGAGYGYGYGPALPEPVVADGPSTNGNGNGAHAVD
jgi:capsular exopolysaccharide synthesis family protein